MEFERAIQAYFKACEGLPMLHQDGTAMTDGKGNPIFKDRRAPTLPGLAVALGLTSAQQLIDLSHEDEYKVMIGTAITRIEDYAASRLFDKDTVRGAEFTLRCQHHWREGEKAMAMDGVQIVIDDIM